MIGHGVNKIKQTNKKAMALAQLVDWSLCKPKIQDLNPIFPEFLETFLEALLQMQWTLENNKTRLKNNQKLSTNNYKISIE